MGIRREHADTNAVVAGSRSYRLWVTVGQVKVTILIFHDLFFKLWTKVQENETLWMVFISCLIKKRLELNFHPPLSPSIYSSFYESPHKLI